MTFATYIVVIQFFYIGKHANLKYDFVHSAFLNHERPFVHLHEQKTKRMKQKKFVKHLRRKKQQLSVTLCAQPVPIPFGGVTAVHSPATSAADAMW